MIVYDLIRFIAGMFSALSAVFFVPLGFRLFCARLAVHYLAVSARYNSLFIYLPFFTKGHKTTT